MPNEYDWLRGSVWDSLASQIFPLKQPILSAAPLTAPKSRVGFMAVTVNGFTQMTVQPTSGTTPTERSYVWVEELISYAIAGLAYVVLTILIFSVLILTQCTSGTLDFSP